MNMCSEVSEKTSTALTLFIFCNPSNVLARFGPSERNSCEVNLQRHLENSTIHLQRWKNRKTQMSIFPRIWEHSDPTFALGRQIGRRIVDPLEDRLLPLQWEGCAVIIWGGEWSLFRTPFTFLKSRPNHTGRWIFTDAMFSKVWRPRGPPQKGPSKERKPLWCVHIYKLSKSRWGDCSHRVLAQNGPMLTDVSEECKAKVMTRLRF